ncbi:nuclear transport factor 2 family protein [Nocardia goodfellowii]
MELKELLDIERQGWDALCDSTGASFYGELMTDDALMILANGMVLDRAGVVESLRAAPPWRAYEIQDPRLVDVGADSKVLVYLGVGYRDAAEPAFRGVMSSTYVLTAGGWRLACYQQTQLAQ